MAIWDVDHWDESAWDGDETPVSNTLELKWNINSLISNSLTLIWNLIGRVGRKIKISWNLLNKKSILTPQQPTMTRVEGWPQKPITTRIEKRGQP